MMKNLRMLKNKRSMKRKMKEIRNQMTLKKMNKIIRKRQNPNTKITLKLKFKKYLNLMATKIQNQASSKRNLGIFSQIWRNVIKLHWKTKEMKWCSLKKENIMLRELKKKVSLRSLKWLNIQIKKNICTMLWLILKDNGYHGTVKVVNYQPAQLFLGSQCFP